MPLFRCLGSWMLSGITLAILLLAPLEIANAQVSPEESAKLLKPADGLAATLWAAEPMVVNPTTIDIDSRGRVWVTEGLNYRLTRGGNKQFQRIADADKIKILDDTDGDGKADRVTIFADKIFPVPMGIAVEEFWSKEGKYKGCKVYVGNSPDLLVLEDTDGDDKADKRYPLLTGFGGIDSDHGVHGPVLGPDGKLYFTHGDGCCSVQKDSSERQQNFDVHDKSGRHVRSDQLANTLRCNRDGTQFEIIADRQRNNYETCLNSFGNQFTSDNDDDGNRGSRVIWIMDGGKYGYRTPGSPRHWGEDVPGNVPKLVGTGNGSPCGVMVYEGKLLPQEYFGAVLEAEAGPRVINYFPMTRKGAAFRTEHKIMLASEDAWFRPVDVTAAPDGSVFVADWYDGGVGGHQFRDQTTGRIYRVAPQGNKTKKIGYDFATVPGLIEALDSPAIAARDVARRLFIERGEADKAATQAVRDKAHKGDSVSQARASWVIAAIGGFAEVHSLFEKSREPRLIEQAVRILGRDVSRVGQVKDPRGPDMMQFQLVRWLQGVADYPDAGVRRELILAFRDQDTRDFHGSLRYLAANWDGQDRWYLEALGLALRNREHEFLEKLFDGKLYGDLNLTENGQAGNVALPPYFPVDRNEAYLTPRDKDLPANALTQTLGLMWEIHTAEVLPLLTKIMPSLATPELQQAADDVLTQVSDPAGAITLAALVNESKDPVRKRQLLATLGRKLDDAWRPARDDAKVIQAITSALRDPDLRTQGIETAAATGDARYAEPLLAVIRETHAAEEARVAAVGAIGRLRPEQAATVLDSLITDARNRKASDAAAEAAVRTLPRLGDAAERLSALMTDDDTPLGLRREAVRTFAREGDGGKRLVALIREGNLSKSLETEAATVLRVHPDRAVREAVAEVLPIKTSSGKPLPSVFELIRRDGNPAKGREVFSRAGLQNTAGGKISCADCHRVQGEGRWVGPDLSTIGAKYGKDELIRSILNPSSAIGYNYRSLVVATKDGQVLTGLPLEDTPERVVLKTAEGQRVTLRPADIDERKFSELSLMPDGLAATMTEDELVDLLAFLTTLKQPVSIVGQFQVLGPVDQGAETPNQPVVDPKTRINFSTPVITQDGSRLTWRRVVANAEGLLDLSAIAGRGENKGAYLFSPVNSPVEQRARLVLDSSAQLSVWLGGRPLAVPPSSNKNPIRTVEFTLPKGTTSLLIRCNGGADASLVTSLVCDKPVEFRAEN